MAAGEAFNIGRVIQRTFGLIARNWAPFSVLAALFSGLPSLFGLIALPAALSGSATAPELAELVTFGLGAVYLLGAMVLQAALTRASVDELSGGRVSLAAALRAGIGTLLPMLGLLLFAALLMAVAVFALTIVGGIAAMGAGYAIVAIVSIAFIAVIVYLLVRWIAVVPVLVVERPGVIQSLRRSSALTENHRWAIFGLVILYLVALALVQAVLRALIPVAMSSDTVWLATNAVALLAQIATAMVVAVGIAAIYFELRQIKEGVGVEELAQVFA